MITGSVFLIACRLAGLCCDLFIYDSPLFVYIHVYLYKFKLFFFAAFFPNPTVLAVVPGSRETS